MARRLSRAQTLGIFLLLPLFVATSALASAPRLDQTFGKHGRVLAELPARSFPASGDAIDASGRILTAAGVPGGLLIERFMPDGTPDLGFGGTGRVMTPFSQPVYPAALRVDSKGRLVVGGAIAAPFQIAQSFLARFLPDGTLDGSFSGDGLVQFDRPKIRAFSPQAQAIAIDSADRIVVAGDTGNSSEGGLVSMGAFIARYESDGSEDTTFRANLGLFCCPSTALLAVSIDSEGRIVGTGSATYDVADRPDHPVVWRFLPDGHPDPSFGRQGQDFPRIRGFGRVGAGVAFDSKGRILISPLEAGYAVARLRANGSADPTFGGRGFVRVGRSSFGTVALGVSVDGQDRPVVAGSLDTAFGQLNRMWFGYTRLRSNGAVDPRFGKRVKRVGFGQPNCRFACPPAQRRKTFGGPPMLDANGRLVLVGWTMRGSRQFTAIARVRLP